MGAESFCFFLLELQNLKTGSLDVKRALFEFRNLSLEVHV